MNRVGGINQLRQWSAIDNFSNKNAGAIDGKVIPCRENPKLLLLLLLLQHHRVTIGVRAVLCAGEA